MKIHLRILYGADDRFQIVKQTIDVCKDYFDTIKIVNSGPIELERKFNDLPNNTSIETLNYFFGDLESARNALIHDVDLGDYILWLDADERPSQSLLDNLDKIIFKLEKTGIYSGRFPGWNHLWDDNGKQLCEKWDYNNELRFPKDALDYGKKHIDYLEGKTHIMPVPTIGRMVKKLHDFTSANTNFGGHGNIINYKDNIDMHIIMHPIIHLKHNIMVYQSLVTCTYVNPCLNAPIKNGYKPYINSIEYKILRDFQNRTGVKTQNDLCNKLHLNFDKSFKDEFKELCLIPEFKNSELYDNFFKYYHIWAGMYDLSWKTPPIFCGEICCKYKNIQL